jgi:DNA-binding response OmpR family regulator
MGKEGRILVIDDEPMLRDTLRQVLQEEGYQVDVANDGNMALTVAAANPPDLVLLDLMMPGMNGRQFLTAFRSDPRFVQIPVVIMTAVHGLHVNLAAMGSTEVLEKPFAAEDLLRKVALAMYRLEESDPLDPRISAPRIAIAPLQGGLVLLIEALGAQQQSYEATLTSQGCRVISMSRPTFPLARLIRAMSPTVVVMSSAIAAHQLLPNPPVCPVIIVDSASPALDMLLQVRKALAAST